MQNQYESQLEEDREVRERQQQRHYALFSELQNMSSELPLQFQQRIPYETLSALANCLLDETIGQIVSGLRDLQQMLERSLYEKRARELDHLKACKLELQKRNKEAIFLRTIKEEEAQKKLVDFEMQMQQKSRDLDIRIIKELDQALNEQQSTLEKAGVPGFFVTNKPIDIRIQMFLLDFIERITSNRSSKSKA